MVGDRIQSWSVCTKAPGEYPAQHELCGSGQAHCLSGPKVLISEMREPPRLPPQTQSRVTLKGLGSAQLTSCSQDLTSRFTALSTHIPVSSGPSFVHFHSFVLSLLCLTLCNFWTVARQAPLSMEFSRQEY